MSDYNNGQIWEMIWKLLHWIGMQEQEACMRENDYIKLEKERDALEAKLAKAVEAVDKTAALIEDRHVVHMTAKGRNPKDYISDWSLIAKEVRAILAEIKGAKP